MTTVSEPMHATRLAGTSVASVDSAVRAEDRPVLLERLAVIANRVRPAGVAMLLDAFIVVLAMPMAAVLVSDHLPRGRTWTAYALLGVAAALCFLAAGFVSGVYGQVWRYASVPEARRLLLAGAIGTTATVTVTLIARFVVQTLSDNRWGPVSIPGVIAACVFATFVMGLVRYHSRLFARRRIDDPVGDVPVLIVGAGEVGAALARQLSWGGGARAVGFVDDQPWLQGRYVAGTRVVGSTHDIAGAIAATGAHQVVVAVATPPRELMERVSDIAEQFEVPVKVVPGMADLVRSGLRLDDLRNVRIEDLLGRRQMPADAGAVTDLLGDRVVLITGAGGSIGSEIARQVAAAGPRRLLLLDHDETHLHDVVASLPPVESESLLADICDRSDLVRVFARFQPDVVFHAAAHKHVPVLESHPAAAVRTNVQGTANLVELADRFACEAFVMISTDKAVAPSSVMGASKRAAESIVLAANATSPTKFAAVRFGNVLGSRGSVLPTFARQIESGGPVTVTHPEMTRFFMTIPEAVQLVINAAALAEGGELFVLDMGEPVRIVDLARRMIRLSGRRPGIDVGIKITGVRPGEKLHEYLQDDGEATTPTTNPWINRVTPNLPSGDVLAAVVGDLTQAAAQHDDDRIRSLLFDLAHGRLEPALPL